MRGVKRDCGVLARKHVASLYIVFVLKCQINQFSLSAAVCCVQFRIKNKFILSCIFLNLRHLITYLLLDTQDT